MIVKLNFAPDPYLDANAAALPLPLRISLPHPSTFSGASPVRSKQHLAMALPKAVGSIVGKDDDVRSEDSTPKSSPGGSASARLASVPPQGVRNDTGDNTEHKKDCGCHACLQMNLHRAIEIYDNEDIAAGDESVLQQAGSACSRSCKECAEHIDSCEKCQEVDLKRFFKA